MCNECNRLFSVAQYIYQAGDETMEEIFQAITRRYQDRFPDWEIVFLSLPKSKPDYRKQILDLTYKILCENE